LSGLVGCDGNDLLWRAHATIFHIDGKIWTEQGTQVAFCAVKLVDDFRGVIAFGVGPLRYCQNVSRAELNAKTASFAPVIDDVYDTV
jgi:hypothetical protein